MPRREAHGSDFELADCIDLPDKVLSALAHLIKGPRERIQGDTFVWLQQHAILLVKVTGNFSLSLNITFNNKARDNACWKEEVPSLFEYKHDSMEKMLH